MLSDRELSHIVGQQESDAQARLDAGDRAAAAKLWRQAARTWRDKADRKSVRSARIRCFQEAKRCEDAAQAVDAGQPPPTGDDDETRDRGAVPAADEYRASVDELEQKSDKTWDDIGGMDDTKRALKYAFGLLLARWPEGVRPLSAARILLYGPPGTGKTLLAQAASNMMDARFFNVKCSDLMSKWFGESAKLVSALFARARDAGDKGAALIFIDEVDSISRARGGAGESGAERRILSTLLAELDGFKEKGDDSNVITIAATNRPWEIDDAILQRFRKHIFIPLPDAVAREAIFRIHIEGAGFRLAAGLSHRALAERTEGYSGRQIRDVCDEAKEAHVKLGNQDVPARVDDGTIRDYQVNVDVLDTRDFDVALARIRPAGADRSLEPYEQWAAAIGGETAQ